MSVRRKKLGDIFEIASGGTPSRKINDFYKNGDIPWVKTGDLKEMYLKNSSEYITKLGLNESSAKLFPRGTVLIAMYGATIGNSSILSIDASTNQACAAFKPNEKVLPEYLYYYLLSIKEKLISQGVGGAQPNISLSILKKVEIPCYSLNIQKKIVSLLNTSFSLMNKRKAQIEALDQLTQSVFLEMFGDPFTNNKRWGIQPLGELANIIMGQSPDGQSYNTQGIGIPLLNGPTEFGKKFPKEKQWTSLPKKLSKKDDILFCVRGATAGRMNFSDKEYCIGRGLAAIRVKNKNDLYFIYQVLNYMYDYFQRTSDGSTFINIGKDKLECLPIFSVHNNFKDRFFMITQNIESQKQLLLQSLTQLENLFNSLMQRAFKGELFND